MLNTLCYNPTLSLPVRWVYLEPIFGGGTVAVDGARFERIDRDFRYIMDSVANDSKVTALCRINNLQHLLSTLLDQLNRCQKSLNEYLEVCLKPLFFSRKPFPFIRLSNICFSLFLRKRGPASPDFTLLVMRIY